jgi:hypothetical protein
MAGGVLALGWLFERITGAPNPLGDMVAALERHPFLLLCALAVLASSAAWRERVASRSGAGRSKLVTP